MTSRSRLLLVLVWLAGAVVATSIGLLAVRQVASSVGDPAVPVLSDGGVPAGQPGPTAGSSSGFTPPTTAGPVTPPSPPVVAPSPVRSTRPTARTSASFRSQGGTVGVQCSGATPSLLYATPADGYALDERSVEGSDLEVRFEAGERRVKLTISCASGSPRLVDEEVDGD